MQTYRPSTVDLILTKMMRDDPQDAEDIEFLLRQEKIELTMLVDAFSRARCPDVPEIKTTFTRLQPDVIRAASRLKLGSIGSSS